MSRLEETKKIYQNAVDKLQTDEGYFTEYLKYSGRFYKVPATHAIALFENNPNATMLADFDTWKKFGNSVKKYEQSSAALTQNGTRLKHYFDISQTTAKGIPFQWSIDKDITEEFLKDEARINGKNYRNMATYINNAAVNQINDTVEEILSKFDIEEKDKKAFLYSAATMVMTTVAARCEHKSTYKYKTPNIPDLAALHMLKTKEDVIKLCDTIHQSAHSILSKMEKSITQIINIKRTEERHNERTGNEQTNQGMEQQIPRKQGSSAGAFEGEREAGADLVRGNEGVVSDVHGEGKGGGYDSLQAERGRELHLQPSVLGRDRGGNGDRTVRQEMAGVYGGELSRHGTDNEYQQLRLGDSGAGSGQRSRGTVQKAGRTVSESESTPHNVLGNSQVGENEVNGDRPRGDGNGSAAISEQSENSGGINKNAAEASKEASAVLRDMSFSEQVDASLNGKLPFYTSLKVCDTPKILLDVGCEQLPMLYTQRHLKNAIKPINEKEHLHGLTVEQIKKLPELLENPAMIFDSISRNDSIIAVTTELNTDSSPIVVSIKPYGKGRYEIEDISSNFITSVYPKDNFINFFKRTLSFDKVLYCNKERSQELFERWGVQSSELTNTLNFNIIIHQSRNIVNPKTQEISDISENQRDTYITLNAVRLGDFYEIFGEEAKIAAEKLNLALTSRNGERMVGFPQNALEQYKNQLKTTGYNLKLYEDLRQYRAEKIISENAEKYILPKLAFDEQVAITDKFFNYETAWHNVSKEIAEAAERYRKGEDVKIDLTKAFFKHDVNFSEWENVNNDIYKIQISTDEKGADVCCENAKRHFSWEDAAALHWNYLKDTFKEIQLERASEYPEIKEDVDRLIANMENCENPVSLSQSAFTETSSNGFGNNKQTQDVGLKTDVGKLHNFTITDSNLGAGGLKTKCAANIAAIKTLKQIEAENRNATPEEQEILSKYVGWGGMAQEVFKGNNEKWAKEHTELKELLTDEEYAAAQGSTLNAHYTTPTVINAIYKALDNMGFKKGNVLEPAMGVGNFFGCIPEKMKDSKLYGVELDSITGRIAKQLYPNADIQIKGFEKTDFPDNFFDVAIGNVPFGSYGVADRQYDKYNFLIHDYFFAKTLDKVANGGIIAFITSKGTLDKANPKVREYIAKRADLLGAIRLPGGKDGAFKENAGTEVTTDIIFLQKREKAPVEIPDWVYLGETSDGIPVNQYFAGNPEMMLGKMEYSKKMYGNGKDTACIPFESENLSEQLDKAVSRLKTNIALKTRTEKQEIAQGIIPATEDVRNFTHTVIDGKVYFRENNTMTEKLVKGKPISGKLLERIMGLIELREAMRELIDGQAENCSDERLRELQWNLNALYDKFTKRNGYINDNANSQVFREDDDYNTLCALEVVDPEKHTVTKSEIFTKRTVKVNAEITHVDNPQEALQVSLDMKGRVDIPYMVELCGSSHQQVIDRLVSEGIIYLNPAKYEEQGIGAYEEASEYLSGNVRQKLRIAELMAEKNPDLFAKNVEALKKVIPPTIEAGEIKVRLGISWVEPADYQRFLCEYAKASFTAKEPLRRTFSGEYKVPCGRDYGIAATSTYGTKRITSYEIMEQLLNNRDIVIRDAVRYPDGSKHYVINDKETQLAKEKARQMQSAFQRWLWENSQRRQKYVTKYNELFNSIVGREYDGSHQSFPGMSPYIELKPHQKDAVARTKFGCNTLLAHCVGAGKSFEMAAAVMEKKRLGLINKACTVVPKHLVGQTANEWLRLYPQAKLLVATEKDFDKNNRQKFIARCCTGDYDAVVMSYEQFEKIKMSFDYRKSFMDKEMKLLDRMIDGTDGDDRSTVKDLEKAKKNLQKRIDKLLEGGKTKDTSLDFEQLGFDCLVVDEAHNYKNGLVVTKMSRVAGVQTTPAQKSEDILMKTQYLNEKYGCKNIIFATGTPVTNSMTELYTMQRYLRPDLLTASGLQNFDDWASNFGEVVTQLELKPAGNGYRLKKRFSKFVNLPELMQMYKEFADIRTADMLNLPVPEIEGGKSQTVVSKPNDFQKAALQILAERSERIHSGAVDPHDDNMLKITNEARLLGLDSRAINPAAENCPDSKVNTCIDNIMKLYEETKEQKGVQAVFCDIAVNNDDGRFSVYDYLREELERRGIPKNEICAAGDAKNQAQRSEMYAQLRSGNKRIVIASTTKMGTGANVQTRLAAMHHLDIPWKPSDLEQRNGRIVRQGNTFDKVKIFNYVTEDTFDSYMLNIIINKQKFISQLMSGKTPARTCEDVDELVLNYSEMQALATGDPRIKEKIELDGEVARLRTLESEHYNNKYRLEDFIVRGEERKAKLEKQLDICKADKTFAKEHKLPPDTFLVELGRKIYTERKEAAPILQKYVLNTMVSGEPQKIGKFCGFDITVKREKTGFDSSVPVLFLQQGKNIQHSAELSLDSDMGNITRMENILKLGVDKMINDTEISFEQLEKDLQEAKATKDTTFEFAAELEAKAARLEQLNVELNKPDEVVMLDEEEEQDNPDLDENLDKYKPKHKPRR